MPFTANDITLIARQDYISRQVVEALYRSGLNFSQKQIQALADMGVFSLPEVLYTYTINDGDSQNSVGNRDGMIQVGEGVDFSFIIKNNSVFKLSDLKITLDAGVSDGIDLFNNISPPPGCGWWKNRQFECHHRDKKIF